MKRGKWHLVIWETVLILASVPIFRSVWMFADSIEFLNTWTGIGASFAVGIILFITAMLALNTCIGGKK